jgi:NAD(P)-dependent dehydrogenase (short-subunit alcohol dehydrogenase family)
LNNSNGGMGGKTVLITGGTSGIGKATAVALAAMGANVVVVGRNPERGGAAVEEIKAQSHSGSVELMLADLSVQAQLRRLAKEFLRRHDRLDMLANNAGLVQSKRTETPDGIETTLAINHLAPFLLTNLLIERLEQSAPSRVITVSSEAQRWGNMDFEDMQSRRKYRGFPVYGMTKLANIMFTYELAERLDGTGVSANCLHPGSVDTNFGKNNRDAMALFFRTFKLFMRSPEQGADTLIWLSSSFEVDGVSGKYFSDRKEIEAKKVAYDPAARRRLWEISEDLTGVKVAA